MGHTHQQIADALSAATRPDWARVDLNDGQMAFWSIRIGRINYWFASHDMAGIDFVVPGISGVTDDEEARTMALNYLTDSE